MSASPVPRRVRIAELLAALSLGVDLGFGQPMEHVLRQCLIALRIAERLGLDDEDRATVYFTALLINIGCHSDAHEQARWFGDDIAIKAVKFRHGMRGRGTAAAMGMLGAGSPPLHRFRLGLEFLVAGHREMDVSVHLKVAHALAETLGLSAHVQLAVDAAYEHWDGRGWPQKLAGHDIPSASRVAQLAEYVEVAHRVGGIPAATTLCRRLAGTQFDPAVVKIVRRSPEDIFAGLDAMQTWSAVLQAEPTPSGANAEVDVDVALPALARFIDLKSPYSLGHSENVAALAASAAEQMGVPRRDIQMVYRAGHVVHFGRLGVSNAIWDKRGPLGAGEWERVRLVPYFTDRMLRQSDVLRGVGALASNHCERMDGSGYPRGLVGSALPTEARILAAANVYQALCEPRPHRPAFSATKAAAALRNEARGGRLDADSVEAVLGAAGHRTRRRPEQPGGLTPREVDVLRLVAQGLATKEIARELSIAPKTVGNHIEHIYSKVGVTNRAEAGLFAVRHGLFSLEIAPRDAR